MVDVDLSELIRSVIEGDVTRATSLTKANLNVGVPAKDILEKGALSLA